MKNPFKALRIAAMALAIIGMPADKLARMSDRVVVCSRTFSLRYGGRWNGPRVSITGFESDQERIGGARADGVP